MKPSCRTAPFKALPKSLWKRCFFGAKDSVLEVDPKSAVYTAALQEQTPGRFAYGTKLRRGLELVSGVKARGRNLSGLNLSDLSLDGSDFREVDLTGADLGGTSFVASQLDDLIAIGADFVNGSIAAASAQRAVFDDTNWNFSSLANADLVDASFLNADLRFTNLLATDFSNADRRGANLTNLDLTAADLRGALMDASTIFCSTVMLDGSVEDPVKGLCSGQPTFVFNPVRYER